MGDHDQREHRRKRHNKGYRAKEKDDGNPFPLSKKAPSILTKSSAEKSAAQGKSTESSLQVPNQPPQPTIILKARDTSSPSLRNKAENVNGPNHTIPKAGSTANIQSLLAPYPQMNSAAVKLIDENLEFHTGSLQSFLTEQTDFTVIGVIGLQGSGKSTILSHLVSNTDCR
uniref:Protein SMG9 n=1 Tax=Cacopsylla melanoneura TaxID=428564 RepID=A0A8D9AHT8_9HEMI